MASDERHPETEWISVDVAPGEKHDDVRLEISAGGRIEGTIHPAAGEVAHRKINLYSLRGSIGWRETETDEAGRFVIDGVIPQDYIIELRKVIEEGGGTTEREEIRKKIEVKDGETTEVVFGAPTRSIRVRGMITSRGLPLSGIEVQPYSADGNEDVGTKVTTGLDGRYEMSVPGAGEYWFSVSANEDSYVGFTRKVPEEEAVELSFDVPGGVIAGRVLDPSGKPVGRAPISVTRTGSGDRRNFYRDDYRSMPSASDGTFEFRLLAPGTYTLRTPDGCKNYAPMHVPFGRAVLTDLLVDEQTQLTSIEVRLPAEGRITGTVVDAQGAPVTEAWICVKDVRGISLSGDWETQTDATGHFEVWSVAPGTCTVRVRTQELDVTSAPITVEAGKAASTRIELR
jgi:protocatechuate 3,4-dioxygenase beta subunit